MPEIAELEQVQRIAASAIKSWREFRREARRAKPVRLARGWGSRSCPQASRERSHQGGGGRRFAWDKDTEESEQTTGKREKLKLRSDEVTDRL